MKDNLSIKLENGENIQGIHPIVIIGPNGAGKTTFANNLAKKLGAEWIGATRNLQFQDSIPMQAPEQAIMKLDHSKRNAKENPRMLSNELDQLLVKLKAEDSAEATKYRDAARKTSERIEPEITKIIQLMDIWNALFPKRKLDLSSYSPRVTAAHRKDSSLYGISCMSDGERVALYLLARAVDAPSGLLFIDEPEIHFHSVLDSVVKLSSPKQDASYLDGGEERVCVFSVARSNSSPSFYMHDRVFYQVT